MKLQERFNRLMTTTDVANVLGCSIGALRQKMRRGFAPKPFRIGARMVWRPEDVDVWLEQQAVAAGGAYATPVEKVRKGISESVPQRPKRGRPRKSDERGK